eukprot:914004-Heterocapsa_arctica.AAC.1
MSTSSVPGGSGPPGGKAAGPLRSCEDAGGGPMVLTTLCTCESSSMSGLGAPSTLAMASIH